MKAPTGVGHLTSLIGQNFDHFFCEADIKQDKPQQEIEIIVQTGRYEWEALIVRQDGRKIRCCKTITALYDRLQKLQGFVVVIRDMTEIQEQQIRLKLLEKAILASSNGIIITDATQANNPIIYVNPGFEKITGYHAEEVKGLNPRFLQGKDTKQPALEKLRAAITTENNCYVTLKNYRKDHTVFWNELTISPIQDEQEKLAHYVGVQKDITEKVEAQMECDRFFSLSIDMLCVANFEGYFVRLNPAWEKTLGYTKEELLSQPFLNFVHSDDRQATQAEAERIAHGNKTIAFENPYLCKDGSYRWLMWNATPFTEQSLIYCVGRDITERKQVEQALKKSEERFRTIADFTHDWEYWLNPERKFIYVSPSCERITGYTPNEFIENANLLKTIVHPRDWLIVKQYLEESFEKEQIYSMDFPIINRQGETRWIAHRCQSVYSEDGR